MTNSIEFHELQIGTTIIRDDNQWFNFRIDYNIPKNQLRLEHKGKIVAVIIGMGQEENDHI